MARAKMFLERSECAELLGVRVWTFDRMVKRNNLKKVFIGGIQKPRYKRYDIERLITCSTP
jgi:hypothetical protein